VFHDALVSFAERRNIFMKKLAPIFFIAIITLTIPFLFHLILWKDNQISEQNLLSFYGTFLSFIGSLSLGYFIYSQDKKRIREHAKMEIFGLYLYLMKLQTTFFNIDNANELQVSLPKYNKTWYNSYYVLTPWLSLHDQVRVLNELEYLFEKIDEINELIGNALFNDAFYIYSKYKIYNLYCAKLTLDEIILLFENFLELHSISLYTKQTYNDKYEYKKSKVIAERMYKPVITWVYYYLKANKLKNCSLDSIKVNLIEWMLKQNEVNDIKNDICSRRICHSAIYRIMSHISSNSNNEPIKCKGFRFFVNSSFKKL